METAIVSCDFCKRRITPTQWLFKLRLGSALDTWQLGTERDACAFCVADEEKGLLTTSDYNLITAQRVPEPPAEGKRTELPERRPY